MEYLPEYLFPPWFSMAGINVLRMFGLQKYGTNQVGYSFGALAS